MILLFAMLGILTFSIVYFKPSSFQREEGRGLTDLTGREDFWVGSYTLIKERPILGYGYGVEGKIWEDPRFYESKETLWSGSVKASLHNGYLSVAIGLGIFIFIIWCIILFIPLYQSISSPLTDYKVFAITIMLMCLFLNLFESVITGSGSLVAILFWMVWIITGNNSFLQDKYLTSLSVNAQCN